MVSRSFVQFYRFVSRAGVQVLSFVDVAFKIALLGCD